MKKIITLIVAIAMITVNAWSQSLSKQFNKTLKSVDSLTGAKSEAVSGTLPAGREILPALWHFTHEEIQDSDKKFIAATAKLNKFNIMDNEYQLRYEYFYKFGVGNQSYVVVLNISAEGNNFSIQTISHKTYAVDKNLKHTNDGIDANAKQLTQDSKGFVQMFENMTKNYTDEEYEKWNDAACYDFEVQLSVSSQAANKLKAKRWYEAHPILGRKVELPYMFTSIKESKKSGFAYELSGLCGIAETVLITVYSNNDDYVDTKDNQVLQIKGTVSDIKYTDSDFDKDYKIKWIYIEEE